MTHTRPRLEDQLRRLARRRDQHVLCPACGKRTKRKSRQQVYCSPKCRKAGAYARNGRTAINFPASVRHTGLGTKSPKNVNGFNALHPPKSASSAGIVAPRAVIEAEVFAGREWREIESRDGVTSHITTLRKPALVRGAS